MKKSGRLKCEVEGVGVPGLTRICMYLHTHTDAEQYSASLQQLLSVISSSLLKATEMLQICECFCLDADRY